MRNFKSYRIWQQAMILVEEAYTLTKALPRDEEYLLLRQIRKSAISIPSNIAEGCGRKTDKEFSRFLEIALGSAFELETQLMLAGKLFRLAHQSTYETVLKRLLDLQPGIHALIQTLAIKKRKLS